MAEPDRVHRTVYSEPSAPPGASSAGVKVATTRSLTLGPLYQKVFETTHATLGAPYTQCENSPPRCRLRVQRASQAASSTVERW
eukprot:scaffold1215_cov99-Phaeocystis_antarctica.AAC.1